MNLLSIPSRLAVSIAAMALASGSCTSTPDAPLICPEVALVGDAMTITRFLPRGGEDLTDVDFTAELSNIDSQCMIVGGGDQDQTVVVTLTPAITAVRGPANTERKASVDYLVSVTDQGQNILSVQRFPVSVAFVGNRSRVTVIDNDPPVTVAIPLPQGRSADDYQILVAFQLAPQELEYNRRTQNAQP